MDNFFVLHNEPSMVLNQFNSVKCLNFDYLNFKLVLIQLLTNGKFIQSTKWLRYTFPSYRNETTKKKTKKTKEKQQKLQRPQQWEKYEKDKGWDFFLGKYRSFDGNLFFLFSLEPMLFQIKKLVLLCALQIKPTLSTPDFQPLFGMWKYVYSSAECLKDLSLFYFFKNKITFRYLLQTPGSCSFNSFGPNTTIKKSLGPNFHWSIRNKSVLKYTSMRTNTS